MKAGVAVTVHVIVTNARVSINEIDGFRGQMKDTVVYTKDILSNGQKLKDAGPDVGEDDPLDIPVSRDFIGYRAPPLSIGEKEKLAGYLTFRSLHDKNAQKMKKAEFADKLNALYTVRDDQGMDYSFAFIDNVYFHPVTKEKMRTGMKWMNLSPHPVEVYGSEAAANLRTYTVTKK